MIEKILLGITYFFLACWCLASFVLFVHIGKNVIKKVFAKRCKLTLKHSDKAYQLGSLYDTIQGANLSNREIISLINTVISYKSNFEIHNALNSRTLHLENELKVYKEKQARSL